MLERVSSSYEFLRRTLALGIDPTRAEAVSAVMGRQDLSWERVAYLASRYKVAPALFSILSRADLNGKIPADFLSYTEGVHELNGIRNEEILAEADSLTESLNRIGIEPVFLKGVAYLLSGVYPNKPDRFIGDIDLLIASPRFTDAIEQLRKHGFREDEDEPEDPFSHHHQPLYGEADVAAVEVHRRLGTRRGDAVLPVPEMVRDSIPVVRSGIRARVPSPEHMATHLILRTEAEEGVRAWIWPPLRTTYDFGLLVRGFGLKIRWEDINERFRRQGCGYIFQLFCRAAEEWIGVERLPGVSSTSYRLRAAEARLLRNYPGLRFIDPWFLFSVVFGTRVERVRVCLQTPGGLRYIARKAFARRRLKILLADVDGGK